MKKTFTTMAIAFALFAGYSTYNTQNSNELTGIALANVEALTSGEYIPNLGIYCCGTIENCAKNDKTGEIIHGIGQYSNCK